MSYASFDETVEISERFSKLQLFLGILGIIVALMFALPSDLYTSAKWFDSLGLQGGLPGNGNLFGEGSVVKFWKILPPVSYEGTGFSLFLFFANMATALMAASKGTWSDSHSGLVKIVFGYAKGENIRNFNYAKLGWFMGMVASNTFDTFTDADFRGWQGSGGVWLYIQALAMSVTYYSLGSEWCLMTGFQWTLEGLRNTLKIRRNRNHDSAPAPRQQAHRRESNSAVNRRNNSSLTDVFVTRTNRDDNDY